MNIDQAIAQAQERLLRAPDAELEAARNELADLLETKRLETSDQVIALDAGETAAYRRLEAEARFTRYLAAALEGAAVGGAERELNQHLDLPLNRFPLSILAPRNATTDTESQRTQQTWVDRLFAGTGMERVGITMRPVGPGVASFPITTAGGSFAQRGRGEALEDAAWTVGVTEIKPTRGGVRGVFSEEDVARLPTLEAALVRDMRAAATEGMDRVAFLGDSGAGETRANIVGLTTAANVVAKSITQADKVNGAETLTPFAELVDGKHAASLADLGVVASIGANTLWTTSVLPAPVTTGETLAQYMMRAGLSWMARGEIETATTNGKWGAFVGRRRGIEGAGVAAVWNSGQLIRDQYTGASKGEIALTLSYLWGLKFPRPTAFARVKFVT